MTDLQKQDYNNIRTFMIMSSYANIDLWTEDLFEKLYTEFCNECFNSNWRHITKEEFDFVIMLLKKCINYSHKYMKRWLMEQMRMLQ